MLVAGGCIDRPVGSGEETAGTTAAVTSSGATIGLSADGTSGASTETSSGVVGSTSSSSDEGVLDEGPWCSVPGEERIAHCTPDGGGQTFECDVIAQDCPVGEKCSPWANDGGAVWNATRCSPIDPEPDPLGAPCTVEGAAVSGIDSCERGAQCWAVDPRTLEGVCVAMCGGDSSDPVCDDPETTCVIANGGAIALCLPSCDPLLQDCAEALACTSSPGDGGFACMPLGGVPVVDGDACEHLNVCAAGSVCAIAEAVPDCVGAWGCCTPYCDLTVPGSCTAPGTQCVPWWEEGVGPPQFDDEGLCSAVPVRPEGGWLPVDDLRANL